MTLPSFENEKNRIQDVYKHAVYITEEGGTTNKYFRYQTNVRNGGVPFSGSDYPVYSTEISLNIS